MNYIVSVEVFNTDDYIEDEVVAEFVNLEHAQAFADLVGGTVESIDDIVSPSVEFKCVGRNFGDKPLVDLFQEYLKQFVQRNTYC